MYPKALLVGKLTTNWMLQLGRSCGSFLERPQSSQPTDAWLAHKPEAAPTGLENWPPSPSPKLTPTGYSRNFPYPLLSVAVLTGGEQGGMQAEGAWEQR